MLLDDFVMLGRTVPEFSKKHGLVACSAGYSRELRQFIRIYPLPMGISIPRWSVCRVQLRRPRDDSRIESWRIDDDISITGKVKKEHEFSFLQSLAAQSINDLNAGRASLGVVVPRIANWRFDGYKPNEEYLLDFFPEERKCKRKPRVSFFDSGGLHDLQVRDWGAHEFLRKNKQDKHYQLWSALKFDDPSYGHLFFVGNHNQHRTSWLVISVVSEMTKPQSELFAA